MFKMSQKVAKHYIILVYLHMNIIKVVNLFISLFIYFCLHCLLCSIQKFVERKVQILGGSTILCQTLRARLSNMLEHDMYGADKMQYSKAEKFYDDKPCMLTRCNESSCKQANYVPS